MWKPFAINLVVLTNALNPYTSLVYDLKLLESSLPVDARGIRIERLRTIEQNRSRDFISDAGFYYLRSSWESFFFFARYIENVRKINRSNNNILRCNYLISFFGIFRKQINNHCVITFRSNTRSNSNNWSFDRQEIRYYEKKKKNQINKVSPYAKLPRTPSIRVKNARRI